MRGNLRTFALLLLRAGHRKRINKVTGATEDNARQPTDKAYQQRSLVRSRSRPIGYEVITVYYQRRIVQQTLAVYFAVDFSVMVDAIALGTTPHLLPSVIVQANR